jgi:Uma2 family endonuclease
MSRRNKDKIGYYYDSHLTAKDLSGEHSSHSELIHYLWDVLDWLFRGQVYVLHKNLNFYYTTDPREYPMEPDIAVIKGAPKPEMHSWKVGKSGAAPHFVFEIASEDTWRKDIDEKVEIYGHMGVQEYFAYDPNEPPVWEGIRRRLLGWKLNQDTQVMHTMQLNSGGHLWSHHLESFLVPDGHYLRLYDRNGHLRLTQSEGIRAETDALVAHTDTLRAEIEILKANSLARRIQIYEEKLRSLGIDPDQI